MKSRIKEFRARYNLTQQALAIKVGVRRETIVYLEKGKFAADFMPTGFTLMVKEL